MEIEHPEDKPYTVLFICEPEASYQSKTLSIENTRLINEAAIHHTVIVVMLFGIRLNFIAEMQINSETSFTPKSGVRYKNQYLNKIYANCKNDKLKTYLRRLELLNYNFTEMEKMELVRLAFEYKSYKNSLDYKFKSNQFFYKKEPNQLLYIDSPITQLLPQIMELEEKVVIDNERIISQNPNVFVRVLREIEDVNREFLSLRTVISPEIKGRLNVFNFIMFPNDGAFCSLPLIGRIIIPQSYPRNPPVFHLFTRTNRYNLDVFNNYATGNNLDQSSVCFDIVKPVDNHMSRWKPQYTISTVVASMMDAIVSYKVQQMYGGEKEEFVTMQSLASSYSNVKRQVLNRLPELNKFPKIPVIKSAKLLCNPLKFYSFNQNNSFTYIFNKEQESLHSDEIVLQSNSSKTVQFELTNLTAEFVLSFILTNSPGDVKGNKNTTIIFRNGVTATAAKKLANKKLNWFYHGKPLNSGDMKINLTITPNQFAMSYIDESTEGNWVLHGDTPLTSLRKESVGDLSKETFRLCVYVKNKNKYMGNKFIMKQINTNVGYIHNKCQFQ